jgi:hypothetical protein
MFDDCPRDLPSQALFLDRLHRRSPPDRARRPKFAVGALALDRWTTISETYAPHFHESLLSWGRSPSGSPHCLRARMTRPRRLSTNEFALLARPRGDRIHDAGKILAERLIASLSEAHAVVEGEDRS